MSPAGHPSRAADRCRCAGWGVHAQWGHDGAGRGAWRGGEHTHPGTPRWPGSAVQTGGLEDGSKQQVLKVLTKRATHPKPGNQILWVSMAAKALCNS